MLMKIYYNDYCLSKYIYYFLTFYNTSSFAFLKNYYIYYHIFYYIFYLNIIYIYVFIELIKSVCYDHEAEDNNIEKYLTKYNKLDPYHNILISFINKITLYAKTINTFNLIHYFHRTSVNSLYKLINTFR